MEKFPNVKLINKGVSPSNVREILKVVKLHEDKTLDILKLDIDGCECQLLGELLEDPYYRAKIIQIELNHIISPPIAYKDMCDKDLHGWSNVPNRGGWYAWGCSMQAAYDIVRPYGYELLQYDWPDAVFIHGSLRDVFPCLLGNRKGKNFLRNYWIGYYWAREHYTRFGGPDGGGNFPMLGVQAFSDPELFFKNFARDAKSSWSKRPLWVEMSIGINAASFRQPEGGLLNITFYLKKEPTEEIGLKEKRRH